MYLRDVSLQNRVPQRLFYSILLSRSSFIVHRVSRIKYPTLRRITQHALRKSRITHHSSLIILHASFIARRSFLTIHPSPFIPQHPSPSFITNHSSIITQLHTYISASISVFHPRYGDSARQFPHLGACFLPSGVDFPIRMSR